jgi:aspartyl-tRNA(Asn)/glutamyl-tRNA(Gln) amidotransferase subunit C
MKELSLEDVRKVARLARLKLTAEEEQIFQQQLGQILSYVDLLDELDTTGVEPLAHTTELHNVFRDDQQSESLPRNQALANAPQQDGRYFLVPQIIEGA